MNKREEKKQKQVQNQPMSTNIQQLVKHEMLKWHSVERKCRSLVTEFST